MIKRLQLLYIIFGLSIRATGKQQAKIKNKLRILIKSRPNYENPFQFQEPFVEDLLIPKDLVMEIENLAIKDRIVRNNSPYLPGDLRGLIVGPSSCGKSVVLFNLLLQDGWLDYNHLLVFGNSLFQKEGII